MNIYMDSKMPWISKESKRSEQEELNKLTGIINKMTSMAKDFNPDVMTAKKKKGRK